MATKTFRGRFLEDFRVGEILNHSTPRTVTDGERALYNSLYPVRHALYSSDEFARQCGLRGSPLVDFAGFHMVFGKTVPDISLNAVANLGYAEGRFFLPVYPGDTLRSISEVIGVKENSNGKTGVVWVRTCGKNQHGKRVIEYVRWVMIRKRNPAPPSSEPTVPVLAGSVPPEALPRIEGLDFSRYQFGLAGEPFRWGHYEVGETIDHIDGTTIEEAEHMLATRMWQNTARVHFDRSARPDGRRLIYGGHVISLARALSFNGLANAQIVVALNSGTHANPCFAGDTVRAWSEILDKAKSTVPGAGALRLRTIATKGQAGAARGGDGKYLSDTLLDLDYWVLIPV